MSDQLDLLIVICDTDLHCEQMGIKILENKLHEIQENTKANINTCTYARQTLLNLNSFPENTAHMAH